MFVFHNMKFHDYGVAPEPIHCRDPNEKIAVNEDNGWYATQNEDHVKRLDDSLRRESAISNNDHVNEIKKYTCGSFDLNKRLITAHEKGKPVGSTMKGTNYDWFHSNGNDKPPYEGYHSFGVEHHLPTLDNLTKRSVGRHLEVYAGVRFDPEHFAKHGKLLVPSYLSTSIHKNVTREFSDGADGKKRVLQIQMRPNDQGRYINEHHTFQTGEYKEMLLPRRTVLKLGQKEERGGFIVHHATVHAQE